MKLYINNKKKGGIFGLFLGGSYLTGIEIFEWIFKIIAIFFSKNNIGNDSRFNV